MTSNDTAQNTETTEPETVTVEVFIEETITYTGTLEIDPVDFLEATGVELSRATGSEIREYAIDAGINHEERNENVAGQEWSDPVIHGDTVVRTAFEVDGVRNGEIVEDIRVLVDPARFQEATSCELATASTAQVLAYITEHVEECDFAGAPFSPVRLCRAG